MKIVLRLGKNWLLSPNISTTTEPFLPREAMLRAVYAIVVCLSVCVCVCLCVCLTHFAIVSKRLNIGSRKQHRTIAP